MPNNNRLANHANNNQNISFSIRALKLLLGLMILLGMVATASFVFYFFLVPLPLLRKHNEDDSQNALKIFNDNPLANNFSLNTSNTHYTYFTSEPVSIKLKVPKLVNIKNTQDDINNLLQELSRQDSGLGQAITRMKNADKIKLSKNESLQVNFKQRTISVPEALSLNKNYLRNKLIDAIRMLDTQGHDIKTSIPYVYPPLSFAKDMTTHTKLLINLVKDMEYLTLLLHRDEQTINDHPELRQLAGMQHPMIEHYLRCTKEVASAYLEMPEPETMEVLIGQKFMPIKFLYQERIGNTEEFYVSYTPYEFEESLGAANVLFSIEQEFAYLKQDFISQYIKAFQQTVTQMNNFYYITATTNEIVVLNPLIAKLRSAFSSEYIGEDAQKRLLTDIKDAFISVRKLKRELASQKVNPFSLSERLKSSLIPFCDELIDILNLASNVVLKPIVAKLESFSPEMLEVLLPKTTDYINSFKIKKTNTEHVKNNRSSITCIDGLCFVGEGTSSNKEKVIVNDDSVRRMRI